MQSCKITTSWLDLLLASVEVEKYKNWFNPKHCNQALCTEGKWEKIRHNLCWFDFLQCFRSLLTSSKPCAVAGLIYCNGLNFQEVQLCCKFARRRMVLVGKVHKVYKVRVQQPSELWPPGSPPHLHTGSTHPTFSERGSLMWWEILLKSRLFWSNIRWLFNNGLVPPKAGFRKLRM